MTYDDVILYISLVTLPIQLAAADALCDLCPSSHPNRMNITNALIKWTTVLYQSSETAPLALDYNHITQNNRCTR